MHANGEYDRVVEVALGGVVGGEGAVDDVAGGRPLAVVVVVLRDPAPVEPGEPWLP